MADSPIPSPLRTAHVAGDGAFADAMRDVADSEEDGDHEILAGRRELVVVDGLHGLGHALDSDRLVGASGPPGTARQL